MSPKPSPTEVNRTCITGPIYKWNNITDEQATALGISPLPGRHYGSTSRVPEEWTARRLRSGLLNVTIHLKSPLMEHSQFGEFIDSVIEGEFGGSYETMPIDLREQPGISVDQAGQWSYDVLTKKVIWSPKTYQLYGLDPRQPVRIDDIFKAIHPEDRGRMMHSLNDAAYNAKELDEVYRVVVQGNVRHLRCRGKPFDIDPGLVARRVAGMVCEEILVRRPEAA